MSEPILRVENLEKEFGVVHAVRGISFDIEEGQVVGFIGANGAGKTTTMRIMATLDLPTSGKIAICGYDIVNYPEEVRARVGWMPDNYGVYTDMTVHEYLDFFARSFGYKGEDRRHRVDEVIAFTDLASLAERGMDTLSKGMGQRLCLGRTLLHDPEFLILDEPAAGLDPKARIELKRLIRLLAEDGKTIFISSHILSELEEMCDTMLLIDEGEIVHHGSADGMKKRKDEGFVVAIRTSGDPKELERWALLYPGAVVEDAMKDGIRVIFDSADSSVLTKAMKHLMSENIPIIEFRLEERNLEDAFVDILAKVGG